MKLIVRSPRAEQDISEIFDWIADSSPANAERYVERIVSTLCLLADMPLMGSLRLPSFPAVLSFPVGNHLVFYRPIENGIEVIRILHGARDWESADEML
jgi:toxin ParE1/3/4